MCFSARGGWLSLLMRSLFILVAFLALSRPVSWAAEERMFSYGKGPYELIIFTDYFCAPCQKAERELDPVLEEIIERGVKITMVDFPLYKLTPLYARHFLYAVNASSNYKEALRARRLLNDRASRMGALTAEHLERDFKNAGIAIKPYDTKTSLSAYSRLIKKYEVRSTPTFVFVYSPTDIRKYSGSEPVKKGMAELKKALSAQ